MGGERGIGRGVEAGREGGSYYASVHNYDHTLSVCA